ncbi:phosphonate transport system substrate-binding protein [Tamaricihabitans halophyticus]|uniref:Phosphonate transport system substrate-binding protein n=1 Tax=Tamaricihabitans halophyticus TaxID=1262583 RepID=A0A4R2QV61_9PSEU|nr:phosphate/phosphite/phosphonate ABC transporter substrate-binding protein [Tamaricihabitans halophyticus]TCP53617.1 phosphonate transport system substrate-binding protein [Tamaricihabitans halophyticus]
MTRSTRQVLGPVAVTATAALMLAGCGQSAANDSADQESRNPDQLVFAAVPSEESTSLQQSYQSVIDMLEEETGKKITFQHATDYAAIIEGQRTGKVDIAQYGPFSYVLARSSGVGTTPVGAQVEEQGAEPGYQSYAITKPGSGITKLADMRGKKVCFVDPNSTSGYLYPSAGLIEAGLNPEQDIEEVMTGGHDASALAVASGQCEAGFAFDDMVDVTLPGKGQLKKGDLEVIWKSETIAGSPAAIADDLDPALRKTITDAFQEKANVDYLRENGFCDKDCSVGEEGSWGYTDVDDAFYDGVREVCEITDDEQCQA